MRPVIKFSTPGKYAQIGDLTSKLGTERGEAGNGSFPFPLDIYSSSETLLPE
jgi:hypothetical protein